MRRSFPAIAVIAATLFTMPPPAASAEPLQAISAWDLDYGETQCIAMRDYGPSDHRVTLAIIPAPNGETYELLVGRKRSGPAYAEEVEGSVDFGSGPMRAWLLHYSSQDRKLDLYQYRITAAEMAQARSASAVVVRATGEGGTGFELQTMPALLDGLQKCTDDLKDYWNIDRKRTGGTPATGDVRSVFTPADYPPEASVRHQEGRSQYLLLIDEKGAVAGCHVLKPSGVPALGNQGCAIIQKRARFTPARDSKGNPVRDSVVTPEVSWRLAR
jgi:TonB family protein